MIVCQVGKALMAAAYKGANKGLWVAFTPLPTCFLASHECICIRDGAAGIFGFLGPGSFGVPLPLTVNLPITPYVWLPKFSQNDSLIVTFFV